MENKLLEVEAEVKTSNTVNVVCPTCNKSHEHHASSWPLNNGGGFSTTMGYAFTCSCKQEIEFMLPQQSLTIEELEKQLTVQLNYGGIFVDGQCNPGHIEMAYECGDLTDEIGQMRRLASAFTNLANALEQP